MNSKFIRKLNTARLFHAIRQRPGVSQSKLRAITNVDRSTISTIVQQLELDGLVKKRKATAAISMGRPEDALEIIASAGLLVGIALEPNHFTIAVTGLDGVVLGSLDEAVPKDPNQLGHTLARCYAKLLDRQPQPHSPVRGFGLTFSEDGDDIDAMLLRGPLAQDLEALTGVPIAIESRAKAAALAEHNLGAARGIDHFVYVLTGSRMSGALIFDGDIYRSNGGDAGNLAHTKVEPNGRRCECGAHGCLQAYVTEAALLARLAEFNHPSRSVHDVAHAARGNDALVKTVLSEAGNYLGFALSSTANLLSLPEVVLGGDLAILAEAMMPALRQTLTRNVFPSGRLVSIRRSSFGSEETMVGSIALAMNSFLPVTRGADRLTSLFE